MSSGVLNTLKPPGMTSHDVVDFVRGLLPKGCRVGHAGTLDPGAAGVLVLCTGQTTRLIEYLTDGDKAYRAEVTFGVTTDTLDSEGTVVSAGDASGLPEADVRTAVQALIGPQMMTPPMHSAARVAGRRLYELAREGQSVERPARPITVHDARLVDFAPGEHPTALLDIRCSKGTYVRVLCAQLGQSLGLGAYMSFLVRTAVATHTLEQSVTLAELQEASDGGRFQDILLPPTAAVAHLPEVRVGLSEAAAFRQGTTVRCGPEVWGLVRVHDAQGRLLGVGEVADGDDGATLQPRKVLALS